MESPDQILVVEDDTDARELVSEVLRLSGFEVREAGDGREALEQLRNGLRPRVIVLDLMMPRMGGAEFLSHLVEFPGSASMHVVVTTAAPQLAAALPCETAAVLRKPFELDELERAVRRALA